MTAIASWSNPKIKRLKKLLTDSAYRREEGVWVVEGVRQAEEALLSSMEVLEAFADYDEGPERKSALLTNLSNLGVTVTEVTRSVMREFSDTATPQGISLLIRIPAWDEEVLKSGGGPIVVLDRVRDPGNFGTILRTAAAAGAAGAVSTATTVDPGNPKALRASAGAAFRLPHFKVGEPEEVKGLLNCPLYTTSGRGGKAPEEIDLGGRFALVMGQEAEGIGQRWEGYVDSTITIPMAHNMESLNVAAAAAAILFEAARQRRGAG